MSEHGDDQVSGKPSQAEGETLEPDDATTTEPQWPVGHPSQAEGEDPDADDNEDASMKPRDASA